MGFEGISKNVSLRTCEEVILKLKFVVEVKFNWMRVGREGIPGRGNSVCKYPETWAPKKYDVSVMTK